MEIQNKSYQSRNNNGNLKDAAIEVLKTKEIYFARREEEGYWTEISEDEKRIVGKYNQALKIMCWNIFWILTSLEGENYSCPKIIKVEEWIWFYCSCYR